MPRVGFEHTISVFEIAKTVDALDRAAGHCDRYKSTLLGFKESQILKDRD
jgi:hypothetical protein